MTANTYVELVDESANSPGVRTQALYVNDLIVPAGATSNLDGSNLYVDTEQVSGAIISGGADVSGEVFNDRMTARSMVASRAFPAGQSS